MKKGPLPSSEKTSRRSSLARKGGKQADDAQPPNVEELLARYAELRQSNADVEEARRARARTDLLERARRAEEAGGLPSEAELLARYAALKEPWEEDRPQRGGRTQRRRRKTAEPKKSRRRRSSRKSR